MPLRPRTFGLSVEGSTAAANARGRAFEDALDVFSSYLATKSGRGYALIRRVNELPPEFRRKLSQFFVLASTELQTSQPTEPHIGDIYRDSPSDPVKIFTGSEWKEAAEGIEPDRVLYCVSTGRAVLIEAKYGDTEGNAHIERAGARATPAFLQSVATIFEGKARYLYVFSGPMVTTRWSADVAAKIGERGNRQGQIVQTPDQRRFASSRYWRQIEVLFGGGQSPVPWNTLLWDDDGPQSLIGLFEQELQPWLDA
jgi:hypothetical protein